MLDNIKYRLKLRKALNLISRAYSDQIDLTVYCTFTPGTVYVHFKDVSDELDSSEIQWLAPEAYDILISMELIKPARM